MEIEIQDNSIVIVVEKVIYSLDVLHKCFYWYGANFQVDISTKSETLFQITLQPLNSESLTTSFPSYSQKIRKDLIDFKLRDTVTKETQNIRDLLIAKAFAYYEVEDNPTTEVSDPVGFNPKTVS